MQYRHCVPASDSESVEFRDRKVVVTGGSRGLGRVIVERFLAEGASVVTCGRRPIDEPIEVDGRSAQFIEVDIRDGDAAAGFIDAAASAMGGIDVLINSAGGAPPAAAADGSWSFNNKILTLNLLAPIGLAREAYRHMAATGGVIVNIGSISGMRANPMGVAYGAAKAGLINATATLALEWGPDVRVVTVSAGPLLTAEAAEWLDQSDIDRIGGALTSGRLVNPTEIADAVLLVASDRVGAMTGNNLVVDGGPEWPQSGFQRPDDGNGLQKSAGATS